MAVSTTRPDPSPQRKAALVLGGVQDHTGAVEIASIPGFDLDRTIFQTLEGRAERLLVKARVGREVTWKSAPLAEVEAAYAALPGATSLPALPQGLLQFMANECDFDVEHADGSFVDHLFFCFEYAARHYPGPSPLISFLHSILGTGTNTFAMDRSKIPQLRSFLTDEEWTQIEAFPTVLRLLYDRRLPRALRANLHRLEALEGLDATRVLDDQPFSLDAEELWVALNLQLLHLVDFLPVANWSAHQSDPSFVLFRDLYSLLEAAGQLRVSLAYTPATGPARRVGERTGLAGWIATLVPVDVVERRAAQSVQRFSERCGHTLEGTLRWADEPKETVSKDNLGG